MVFRLDLLENMQSYNYVGLGVGILCILEAFAMKFSLKKLLKLPSTQIESLKAGYVKVSGQVEAINLLTSPLSGRACVYYSLQITGRPMKVLNSKHRSHLILHRSSLCASFWLNDGSGKILLTPECANLDLSLYTTSFRKTGEEIRLNYKEKIKHIGCGDEFGQNPRLQGNY